MSLKEFVASLDALHLVNDVVEMPLDDLGNLSKNLKRFLLDMKVQVDRWDLVVSHFIFHSSMEQLVKESLLKSVYKAGDTLNIWGAQIMFIDHIPENYVLAVDLKNNESVDDSRYICKGSLPALDIKKALSLKAFW